MRRQLQSSLAAWLLTPCLAWAGLALAGCGQKGPLSLPQAPANTASAPAR